VSQATAKYPSVQVSLSACRQRPPRSISPAQAYLPRADFLGQINRASHNNVFGLMLPQPLPVISSISGPVLRHQLAR
jgi:hypothetical protein